MMAETVYLLQEKGFELDQSLVAAKSEEEKSRIHRDYFQDVQQLNQDPNFLPQLPTEWINVQTPLDVDHFRNRLVILDFFTYCCVNCMHILPDLDDVETRHPPEEGKVLVVGIHSAKFENEKVTENIQSAIERYGIHHPVANDASATWWNHLGISCWPTLLILGPDLRPIRIFVGEGHGKELMDFLNRALEFFSDQVGKDVKTLPAKAAKIGDVSSSLRYPGKIVVDKDYLVISDTGNHRILVSNLNGEVQQVIGDKNGRGFKDGSFSEAQFSSPQGLCFLSDHELIVADSDNHAIRLVNLKEHQVQTLVGNGTLGKDLEGGKSGQDQPLSTPWDVCLAKSPKSFQENGSFDTVLIAMAGSHQIWALALADTLWWKGQEVQSSQCFRIAGSGVEENRNNSYPQKAGFAQPSGISFSAKTGLIFIADSESSSIRSINITDGAVKNVAGGSRDPKDLFAFGDCDGSSVDAKFQHPLGVAVRDGSDTLIVADSYNHKLKVISTISTKKAQVNTVVIEGLTLDEPGGLCLNPVNEDEIYVTDTNHHLIKLINMRSRTVSTKVITLPKDVVDDSGESFKKNLIKITKSCPIGQNQAKFVVALSPRFIPPAKLNSEAPSSWKLKMNDPKVQCLDGLTGLFEADTTLTFEKPSNLDETKFEVHIKAFMCNQVNGMCYVKQVVIAIDLHPSSMSETTQPFFIDFDLS